MLIREADAKASGVLGRMRLDGLERVTVPFEERCVHVWQSGAPETDMDVDTLIKVLWVRVVTPQYSPAVIAVNVELYSTLQPQLFPAENRTDAYQKRVPVPTN